MIKEQQTLIASQQAILQLQRQAYESTVALQAHIAQLTQQRDAAVAKRVRHKRKADEEGQDAAEEEHEQDGVEEEHKEDTNKRSKLS